MQKKYFPDILLMLPTVAFILYFAIQSPLYSDATEYFSLIAV